jgi:hypothetical protein
MKPGRVLWALVALNILIGTMASPCTKSVNIQTSASPLQIDVKSWFMAAERSRMRTEGAAVCVDLQIADEKAAFQELATEPSGALRFGNIVSRVPRRPHAPAAMYVRGACLLLATLRRAEIVVHPFRAYPLPFPNADLESPLTYRI